MISFNFTVTDDSVLVTINEMTFRLSDILEAKMRELTTALKNKVLDNLAGKVVQTKTGALLESIRDEVIIQEHSIRGEVFVAEDSSAKAYARVLEYGGKNSYSIYPIAKRALRFVVDDKVAFAAYVTHPPLKAHSYLRSALADFVPFFISAIDEALNEAIHG